MSENSSSETTDWWIWLTAALLILYMLGNALGYLIGEGPEVPSEVATEVVIEDPTIGASDLGFDYPGSVAGESDREIQRSSRDGFSALMASWQQSWQRFLAEFSLFESAAWYVWFIAFPIILLSIFVMIYSKIRYNQILRQWDKDIDNDYPDRTDELIDPGVVAPAETGLVRNERWQHIEELIASENESDWRQAIMEADILLDEMVTNIGYRGANLGEKLKTIELSDFRTLNIAWEAHKVRNRIAHEGSAYHLGRDEFLRVMSYYRRVFMEFHFV